MTNIEEIYDRYKDRILKILNAIRLELHETTTLKCSDTYEYDEMQWGMLALSPKDKVDDEIGHGVDISVNIVSSEENDGEDNGVNFEVNTNSNGGGIVARLAPYNYTPQCWVNRSDSEAVEHRFKIIEQADLSELMYLIVDWYKQNRKENVEKIR